MEQNKFQRIVWSINGVLILLAFLVAAYSWIKSFWRDSYHEPEIIVGEQLEEAKKKGLILQGLEYDTPFKVYGTSGYLLPVSIKTYDVADSEGDYDKFRSLGISAYSIRDNTYYNTVNIVFLDSQFRVSGSLLDKKGFIKSFEFPSEKGLFTSFENVYTHDTTIHHISLLIGFEDTNNDGALNEKDKSDLYLTDLNGNGFTKATNNIDVVTYKFLGSNEILIKYSKREEKREEHKKKYFAKYYIKEKKFEDLIQFNQTLDGIHKEMIK